MYCKTSLILKYILVCLSLFYIKPLTFINIYIYRYESIYYMHVTIKQRNIKRVKYIVDWFRCIALFGLSNRPYRSLREYLAWDYMEQYFTIALTFVLKSNTSNVA